MNITSHFIGVKLRSEFLVDIYVVLQKALWSDTNALEFQNILSTHITLYYLPADICEEDVDAIQKSLESFSQFPVNITGFSYFPTQELPQLCYLVPDDSSSALSSLHTQLKHVFPMYESVPENRLNYIPHITLFKIRDMEGFLRRRAELEEVLKTELARIRLLDLFESFRLFRVNSHFKPEIQIEV